MDLVEPEVGSGRSELPKPPGYSEQHGSDQDDRALTKNTRDYVQLKLKVNAVPLPPTGCHAPTTRPPTVPT
jgi:hypothetical protein